MSSQPPLPFESYKRFEITRKQSSNPKDGKYRDRHILHSDYKYKVILLGDIQVGKQTLMNKFTKEEESEVEETAFHKTKVGKGKFDYVHVMVDDKVLEIHVFHPNGLEKISTLPDEYYVNVAAVLYVYDLNSSQSCQNLKFWLKEVRRFVKSPIQLILGNKSDEVPLNCQTQSDGNFFAYELNAPYYRVSAKTGENVDNILYTLAKLLLENTENVKQIVPKRTSGSHCIIN